MGTEQSAAYYDSLYTDPDALYALPPEEQPWRVLWEEIAGRIESDEAVVDAGCGKGQLLQHLHPRTAYLGIDFSEEAIQRATTVRLDRPGYTRFLKRDITKMSFVALSAMEVSYTFVFCEVLEHIEDDLAVLSKVPEGARVIITVPRHDDPSHVRNFKQQRDAVGRYAPFLDIVEAVTIHNRWHLIEGFRT